MHVVRTTQLPGRRDAQLCQRDAFAQLAAHGSLHNAACACKARAKHALCLNVLLAGCWSCCCSRLTSGKLSKRHTLPPSLVSFHHLRPTSSLPVTFFTCSMEGMQLGDGFIHVRVMLQGCVMVRGDTWVVRC